jgi:protein-arginine kinase activator protein McsA
MSKLVPMCAICDERAATLKIIVQKITGEYYDDTEVCSDCAHDPAAELCLILPPKE